MGVEAGCEGTVLVTGLFGGLTGFCAGLGAGFAGLLIATPNSWFSQYQCCGAESSAAQLLCSCAALKAEGRKSRRPKRRR